MLHRTQDVLDLIEKPLGVIDLLDEQCKFPRVRLRFCSVPCYPHPSWSKSHIENGHMFFDHCRLLAQFC